MSQEWVQVLRRWFKPSPPEAPRNTSVQEFLYVDHVRLSAYVDQLRAPVTYDKVPSWTAELSTTGPTAKAAQTGAQRAYTAFEQLKYLERALRDSKQLVEGRWRGTKDDDPAFRMETCLARRVVLGEPTSVAQQAIWVSRYNPIARTGRPATLVLFEGSSVNDGRPQLLSQVSQFLTMFITAQPALWAPGAALGESLMQSLKESDDGLKLMSDRLALNPFKLFEELGARIFPERCIRTIYRVRSACIAADPAMIPALVTLGYPLSIAEAPVDRLDGDVDKYVNDTTSAEMPDDLREEHLRAFAEMLAHQGSGAEGVDKLMSEFKAGVNRDKSKK